MYYEIFEKLCTARGVKPVDVSRATGISTATLTSWKKGKYTPKADKMQLIANYFNVSLEFMTTGEEPKERPSWYLDEETARIAQKAFSDPNLRVLFDAARDSRPEDIQLAVDMLKRFKETNPDG